MKRETGVTGLWQMIERLEAENIRLKGENARLKSENEKLFRSALELAVKACRQDFKCED